MVGQSYWKRLIGIISRVDTVLMLLDARDIPGTSSTRLERLVHDKKKKLIIAINKTDLLSKAEYLALKKTAGKALLVSAKKKTGIRRLKKAIYSSAKQLPVKVAVVGYPNVGKSQLANSLRGKKVAPTAAKPGHTRGEQWIRVSKTLLLFDTPGVIPEQQTQRDLALKRSIDINRLENPEGAAIAVLEKLGKAEVLSRYGVYDEDGFLLLEKIALKYGKLMRGGIPDTTNVSKIILKNWYK